MERDRIIGMCTWEGKIFMRKGENLQFISSMTVVETGIVILLLAAWHVNLALRSLLCNLPIVNVLETTVEVTCSEDTSHVSSSSAFSLHQLTFGTGQPKKNQENDTIYLKYGPSIYFPMHIVWTLVNLVKSERKLLHRRNPGTPEFDETVWLGVNRKTWKWKRDQTEWKIMRHVYITSCWDTRQSQWGSFTVRCKLGCWSVFQATLINNNYLLRRYWKNAKKTCTISIHTKC